MTFWVDMELSVRCGGAGKHTRARRLREASKQSTEHAAAESGQLPDIPSLCSLAECLGKFLVVDRRHRLLVGEDVIVRPQAQPGDGTMQICDQGKAE
jgi:hypothetical protein